MTYSEALENGTLELVPLNDKVIYVKALNVKGELNKAILLGTVLVQNRTKIVVVNGVAYSNLFTAHKRFGNPQEWKECLKAIQQFDNCKEYDLYPNEGWRQFPLEEFSAFGRLALIYKHQPEVWKALYFNYDIKDLDLFKYVCERFKELYETKEELMNVCRELKFPQEKIDIINVYLDCIDFKSGVHSGMFRMHIFNEGEENGK